MRPRVQAPVLPKTTSKKSCSSLQKEKQNKTNQTKKKLLMVPLILTGH
jgi:hypothetical protein